MDLIPKNLKIIEVLIKVPLNKFLNKLIFEWVVVE